MGTGPPGKKWAKTWAAGWRVSVRERKDTSSREQSPVWRGGGDTDGPPAGAAPASAPRLAGPGPGERGGRAPTVHGPRGRRRGPGQLRPRTGSLLLSLFRPSLGLVGCPTNSDEPVAPPAKAGARAGVKARVFCTVFFGGQLTLVIISTCAFRNANPGLSLSPGTGLPWAPSASRPGPPRGLEADGARVKGGRRARRPRCRARGRAAPGDARGCPAARAGVAPLYFLRAGAASVSAGAGCKRQACATVVFIPGASEPAGAASFAEKGGGASDCLPRSRGSPLAGARGEPPYPAPPPAARHPSEAGASACAGAQIRARKGPEGRA